MKREMKREREKRETVHERQDTCWKRKDCRCQDSFVGESESRGKRGGEKRKWELSARDAPCADDWLTPRTIATKRAKRLIV